MALSGNVSLVTPLLIAAGEQSAGRGRGANRWWSNSGALLFSLVFDPSRDQKDRGSPVLEADLWSRVALTAAVALCDVLQELLPHIPRALKWPNDVLLADKKVAGLLVEVPAALPPAPRRLVLGMGINVNNSLAMAPCEIQATGTSLCDVSGTAFDLNDLVIAWLQRFAGHLHALALGDAGLPLLWQSLCALSGKTIELHAGNRTVRGLSRGIDGDGALLVETEAGLERFYAGVLVRVV
jgi:BirA family biotin operon repressor/biotin-[acetyl-CoA-carboxylase] ligase